MLDIKLIRENPEFVKKALQKRGRVVDFSEFLEHEKERRDLIGETEKLKAQKNKASSQIPQIKKAGGDPQKIFTEMKQLGETISSLDEKIEAVEKKLNDFIISLPNIPADDVKAGGKENNEVIRAWGEKPTFDFPLKNHVDLVTELGLIDYERGAKLGGNGFWIYRGMGAKLEWALLNYFIEEHEKDGYEFILPPHILNYACGYTAGQFPKFQNDVFTLKETNGKDSVQFILPTAETALVNLHRDEILTEKELPKKYYAYTPCYRKEAGSYRTDERGMIRGHQFNKIEMFQYTLPEKSEEALMELVVKAEKLVSGLGLHYRLTKLAAADCSDSMAKTYDIEVWIPSMNDYKEVSSASNANDYQARRGNMRVRRENKKIEFLHTLNASGLATSRILPAIAEQFQQVDGSVVVPEVLRKWIGTDRLKINIGDQF
jgi:seryl-tRNA synthetase